jgi:surface antigen
MAREIGSRSRASGGRTRQWFLVGLSLFCGACSTTHDQITGSTSNDGTLAHLVVEDTSGTLTTKPASDVLSNNAAFHQGAGLTTVKYRPIIKASYPGIAPRIINPRKRLQCVPYARMVSGIQIFGNAHTWWQRASGKFLRSQSPKVGSVMVVRGNRKSRHGHVAVVTRVLNKREIVVDHANWLNQERIHIGTPVIDVSAKNDWSAVRVWYTPGDRYGANVYPVRGFIHAKKSKLFKTVANANIRRGPSSGTDRIATLPRETRLEILEKVNGAPWYRVARRGRELGYVYAPLIEPAG